MFWRPTRSSASSPKTEATTSTQSNDAGHPLTEADVKKLFGFDPDDPNVTVQFMPLDGGDIGSTSENYEPQAPVSDPKFARVERTAAIKNEAVTVLLEVMYEAIRAGSKHAPMHSAHEGYAVLREEVDELWEHVKNDTGYTNDARKEAIQIAAMGVRYVLDLIDAPAPK